MSDSLILGIDGGGSKTLLALADRSGRIVRTVRGDPIDPLGNPRWRETLTAQLAPFAREAGLSGVAAALPVYGEVDELSDALTESVADVFGGLPQRVMNDVDAAHLGAFAGGPGILILSGTGSMAWARDAAGRSFRVGGWGDTIGDEGSGYWIGRRVLNLVSQSIDGRAEPTALVDVVFAELGLDRADAMNALSGWVARLAEPRPAIAGLTPLAARLAEAGDAAARRLIEETADELARHVTTIARQAGISTDWSYAGGTLANAVLRDALAARLGRPPVPPRLSPTGGALFAAAQHLGWQPDADWIGRLAASLQSPSAITDSRKPTD